VVSDWGLERSVNHWRGKGGLPPLTLPTRTPAQERELLERLVAAVQEHGTRTNRNLGWFLEDARLAYRADDERVGGWVGFACLSGARIFGEVMKPDWTRIDALLQEVPSE